MSNVPRRTNGAGPRVSPILFRAAMVQASEAGAKDTTRRIITASNSRLNYGVFSGLDLEAARAVRDEGPPHLAAPCTYPRKQFRGDVTGETQRRIVAVRPRVQVGDLFWGKTGRFGSRAKSTATYEVLAVDVGRVQDMTHAEAMREGVQHVEVPKRVASHALTPREVFAWLWDHINGAGSWASNPWVWVYRYRMFARNVDAILADWEARPEVAAPSRPAVG